MDVDTDQSWKGLYHLGRILLVLVCIGGLTASTMGRALYSLGYPSNATVYLQLVSQKQLLANSLWSLWILIDFLLIAPSIALYLILRRDNRTLALVGTLLSLFYIFYDISVTELNSLTLVSLSQGYASATTDALRATYVAAATYGYAALPLQTVLSFGVGAVGWLLWSVVILKEHTFHRWTGVFGIIVNVIGIIGAAAPLALTSYILGLCQFLAVPLTGLWFIIIGVALFRFNQKNMRAVNSLSCDLSTLSLCF
ncbi:MAG: DUF4386 family protein [Halobacteriota archaeon]